MKRASLRTNTVENLGIGVSISRIPKTKYKTQREILQAKYRHK